MPRSSNRDALLDAFTEILHTAGDRAATLDAVAEKAGVSKGGLLYHFGTKEQLVAGLGERLQQLMDDDLAILRDSPDGPVAAFLRVSVAEDSVLDRTIVALSRLAQDDRYPQARAALTRMERSWRDLIEEEIHDDPVTARIVMLVSDGLYYSSLLSVSSPATSREEIEEVIAALAELRRSRAAGPRTA